MKALLNIITAIPAWVRWVACFCYGTMLVALSLASPDLLPETAVIIPGADKVVHFLMYCGFALLLRWALGLRMRLPVAVAALAGLIGYGLLMEVMQEAFTGGLRFFEWWDVAANTVGALTGWLAFGWWLGDFSGS